MQNKLSMNWRMGSWVIILCSIGFAALADFLFYNHPLGINAAFCTAAVLAVLHVRRGSPRGRLAAILLALALAGLVFAFVEQPTLLNIACAGVGLAMLALTRRRGWTASVMLWASRSIQLLAIEPFRPLLDSRLASKWFSRHPHARHGPGRAIGLWTIPVILTAGFVGLFAWANPLIEAWLRSVSGWITDFAAELRIILVPQRICLWVIAGVVTYALLRAKAAHRGQATPGRIDFHSHRLLAEPRIGIVLRCLILFNLVFAAQMGMDGVYLFGRRGLPQGITYTQYAHRGSYPLVATALLAAVFVLVTFRRGSATERSRLARGLVYFWIGQNILLTISAAQRLHLYVAVDILTRLRLAAAIWMFLVAAGLFWIVVKIVRRRSGTWLIGVNAATLAVVLYICCFFNFSGFIADFDLRHSKVITGVRDAPISLDYFRILGPEALPAVERLAPRLDLDHRRQAIQIAAELRQDLASDAGDWRAWTWRRDRLRAWAAAHPPTGEWGGLPISDQIELPTDTTKSNADVAVASVPNIKSATASMLNTRGRLAN